MLDDAGRRCFACRGHLRWRERMAATGHGRAAMVTGGRAWPSRRTPSVSLRRSVPTDPGQAEAFMYGFISGQCARAKDADVDPASVALSRALAAEFSS